MLFALKVLKERKDMSLKNKVLKEPLGQLEAFLRVSKKIKKNQAKILISGMVDSLKASFISSVSEGKNKIVVTHNEASAKNMVNDLRFNGENAVYYPAKDVIFYFADVHSNDIAYRRVKIFKSLLEGEKITVVMSIDALLDKLIPLERFKEGVFKLKLGEEIAMSTLGRDLLRIGYKRVEIVEGKGQFTIRGGILDIFPVTEETMFRIEFFDDEVDSIRDVNIETKRSNKKHDELIIYPASEFIVDDDGIELASKNLKIDYDKTYEKLKNEDARKSLIEHYEENLVNISSKCNYNGIEGSICYYYNELVSVLDFIPSDLIVIDEVDKIKERLEFVLGEYRESMSNRYLNGRVLLKQMDVIFDYGEIVHILSKNQYLIISTTFSQNDLLDVNEKYEVFSRSIEPYHNKYEQLDNDLKYYIKNGYKIVLLSPSMTRARRLATMLEDSGISAYTSRDEEMYLSQGSVLISSGAISSGFDIPEIKYAILTETDISSKKKEKKRKRIKDGEKIESFSELKVGDYVVHEEYGIGVFDTIERITVENVEKDYVKINYAGNDNLYIDINSMDVIRKYLSKEGKKPRLNKLSSNEWKKTKSRVKKAVDEIATELVELYAKRSALQGFVYSEDTVWQREFEEAFPYEETQDQLDAIEDAKRDMETSKIMDRLICGDVGYGKTEVAIRAAFKAVSDSKQVAYLVPTTILAQQHYNNFVQRMKDYPINIELLSRFRTKKQQAEAIKGIKNGSVDIVIGTHRLLSKDVKFKDLGFLIIDEEQRFGVKHKEKIKEMKNTIDVMTLTATPIPRTLHMSLIGIRDMSVLTEPPHDRVPVRTYVLEKNDEIIKDAITRELKRGGQVFYVYNKVKDIDQVAYKISTLVPEARVTFAHGKMSERELEKVMIEFINGGIDVLVATTIIETGLDISNVNAIIIDDAHRLGLSQLYQLRGRVGRSDREAFAYLMYKKDVILKEEASKRLEAIKQFTQFGAGYKIAMKDLEIRGAGNILGQSQSGHLAAIGYEMYVQMLEDRVKELRDGDFKPREDNFECNVDLNIDGYIPNSYIISDVEKIDIYKKIALINSFDDMIDLEDELVDRFGDIPKATNNLLRISTLKADAKKLKITEIKSRNGNIEVHLLNNAPINSDKMISFVSKYSRRLKFHAGEISCFVLKKDKYTDDLLESEKFVKNLFEIAKFD